MDPLITELLISHFWGTIPGLKIQTPASLSDMENILERAFSQQGPTAIRYPRGSGIEKLLEKKEDGIRVIKKEPHPHSIVVALGPAISRVVGLKEKIGTILSITQIKPISGGLIHYLDQHPESKLIVLEDGAIHGGFGEALAAELAPRKAKVHFMGYGDHFMSHGTPAELEEQENVSTRALEKLL